MNFPRQCLSVRLTRHSLTVERMHLSELLRCVVPEGTPAVAVRNLETGLVTLKCAASDDLLEEIGFREAGMLENDTFDNEGHYSEGFGKAEKLKTTAPSNAFVSYCLMPNKDHAAII